MRRIITAGIGVSENLKLKVFFVAIFAMMGFSSMAQSITVSSTSVCENDPVSFVLVNRGPNISSSDTIQWWISNNSNRTEYKRYKQTAGNTMVLNSMPGNNIYVAVTKIGASAPSPSDYYVEVVRKTEDCPNLLCHESSTGEYIFGTDCDLSSGKYGDKFTVNGDGTTNIVEYFPEDVKLLYDGEDFRPTIESESNLESIFNQTLPGGSNNSFMYFDPTKTNTRPFKLRFSGTKGRSFRIWIRYYIQWHCKSANCKNSAKLDIKLEGEYGNDHITNQCLNVRAREVVNGVIQSNYMYDRQNCTDNQPPISVSSNTFECEKLYAVDVYMTGVFLKSFANKTIQPVMNLNTSSSDKCYYNVALDFVSFEHQTVCITPKSACIGDSVTVNTAGFLWGTDFTWEKKNGSSWGAIPGVRYIYDDGKKIQARIPIKEAGRSEYRVKATTGETLEFPLTGEDCDNVMHPDIGGTNPVCVSTSEEVSSEYSVVNKQSIEWMKGAKQYHWKLISPSGRDTSEYITVRPGPEGDKITITFPAGAESSDSLGAPYILYMVPSIGGIEYEDYGASKEIYLRRTPDVSSLSMTTAVICPGVESEDTARVLGMDSLRKFSEYTYRWNIMRADYDMSSERFISDSALVLPLTPHSNFCGIENDVRIPCAFIVDNHGCEAAIVEDVLVQKMQPPHFTDYALNDTIDWGSREVAANCKALTWSAEPYAEVFCGEKTVTTELSVNKGPYETAPTLVELPLDKGLNVFRYIVTDACNQKDTIFRKINVIDKIKPVFNYCPPAVELHPVLQCDTTWVLDPATATDNCDVPLIQYSLDDPEPDTWTDYVSGASIYLLPGDYTLYWRAIDASGNYEICSQVIRVSDNEKPVITYTSYDPQGSCNPDIKAPDFVASDNCTPDDELALDVKTDGKHNTTGCMYTQTWRANVKDNGDNAADEVTVTYTWKEDLDAPVVTGTLPDLDVEGCSLSGVSLPAGASTISAFRSLGENVDVSDNCTAAADLNISYVDADPTGSCPILVVRSYTITDECGNYTTATQKIYIRQRDFDMPDDASTTISCAGELHDPDLPRVTDACGTVLSPISSSVDETPVCEGSVRYQYTYEDCAGHRHVWTYTYNIVLQNFNPPANGESTIHCSNLAVTPTVPQAYDFCGNALTTPSNFTSKTDVPECEGVVVYTYTYEDCAGHTQPWTYTYTIEKNAPEIESNTLPTSKEISCISDTAALASNNVPTAHNDCGEVVTPTLKREFSWEAGKENCKGTISFVYTYTDCGKSTDWTYRYILDDNVKPEFTCPSNKSYTISLNCDTVVNITAPAVTTPCSEVSISYKVNNGSVTPYTAPFNLTLKPGKTTIYWYAEDACHNEAGVCSYDYDITFKPGFTKHCPDNSDLKLDVCESMTWSEVKSYLTGEYEAYFKSVECPSGDEKVIAPTFSYKKRSEGNDAYVALTNASVFDYTTLYDVKWLFVYEANNQETLKDSCFSTVYLADTSAPVNDCSKIKPITLRPKGCDTVYTVIPPEGVFHDVCTPDAELGYVFWLDGRGGFVYGADSITFNLTNGTHWVTWRAYDRFDNLSDTCGHPIYVVDANPPVINCPPVADLTLEITQNCDTTFNLTAPEVTDACGVAAVYYKLEDGVEHLYDENNAANNSVTFPVGTSVVQWYAKDKSNNVSDVCQSTYTVKDVAKPSITCASDTSIKLLSQCDTILTLVAPVVSDNCSYTLYYTVGSAAEQLYDKNTPVRPTFQLGTTTVTWRAVDPSGNEASCSRDYKVTDSSGVNILCPTNKDLILNVCVDQVWDDVRTHLTGSYAATATRMDCQNGGAQPLEPTFFYKKQSEGENAYVALTGNSPFVLDTKYDVKWLFVSGGGNQETVKDSCFSTVLATDTTAPVANCNIVVPALKPHGCDTIYLLKAPIGAFHDNCTADEDLEYWYSVDSSAFVKYDAGDTGTPVTLALGKHTVSWYAIDGHNNGSDTCSYILDVKDILPPKIDCDDIVIPELNVTQGCDTTFKVGAPTVTDCDTFLIYYKLGDGLEHVYTDSFEVTFAVGDTLLKWYAKDTTGNTSDTCTKQYTVRDVAKPSITCAPDTSVKLRTQCDTMITLVPPVVSDNCSYTLYYTVGTGTEQLYDKNTPVRPTFQLGTTTVTWRAVDPSGNEASCARDYVLTDSSGVNIICPTNRDLVLDVCEAQTWSVVRTHLTGDYAAAASRMDCQNGGAQTLTPTFFYKLETENEDAYVALTDASSFALDTKYDLKWLFVSEGLNLETVKDSCLSTIFLTDISAPSADCEAMKDIVLKPITCDTSYQFLKPEGVFSDNCGESNLTYYYKLDGATEFVELTDGVKEPLTNGPHTVAWKVKDQHNNESAVCEQTVTILDTIAPLVDCAAIPDTTLQVSLSCDTSFSIVAPTVTDACGVSSIYYKLGDGAEHVFADKVDVTFAVGDTLIKWYAKDAAGNVSDTCERKYTVEDVASPKFDCPADTAFKLYHHCDTTFSVVFPNVTDNCAVTERYYRIGSGANTLYTGPVSVHFSLGDLTITWSAYDASGNVAECSRTYTVTDNTSITKTCPAEDDVIINTCDDMTWGEVYALYTDAQKAIASRLNCANNGEVISIDPIMRYKKESDPADAYVPLLDNSLLSYNVSYDIRWVFEKSGTNMEDIHDSCDSKVILKDTSVPTMDCSKIEDIVLKPITCDFENYQFKKPEGVFDDNCTEDSLTYFFKLDGDASFTRLKDAEPRTIANGTHTIVWRVADKMGNESGECSQSLTVLDTIAPEMTCPTDMTVKVVAGCSIALDLPVATATDACGEPKVYFSFDGVSFTQLGATFNHTLQVGDTTIYWYSEDIHNNLTDTCHYKVTVLDTIAPTITCPSDISISLTTGCDTDVEFGPATADDNCEVEKIYYSYDNATFTALPTLASPVTKNFAVGDYKVYWYAEDNHGVLSDTCEQKISILDDHTFDINCPPYSGADPFIVETCTDLPWKDLSDSLSKLNMNASASYTDCKTTVETPIDSIIMKYSVKGSDTWALLGDDDKIPYNTPYVIRWVFVKAGDNLVTKSDSCELPILLKDTTVPLFNCDDINPDSAVVVADGVCELPYKDIHLNTYEATDNCDGKIVGILSTSTNLADSVKAEDVFKVGTLYNLYWIFQDRTGNKVYCDQKLMLNTNLKPIFNCDSLKNSPITKMLENACETDSTSLGIVTPIAYDACTKDPILGVGHRKSGLAMNGTYSVGRDTIVWVFQSIYSTTLDSCEQYIFIQSDKELEFDCDSLNRAVIDTVLSGVCEISAADLKVNTPFALDVCTNDTIWGVGVRKSGKDMTDPYLVGRDTITWTFTSEYAKNSVVCDQFVYIQSNLEPVFNCDSLKNTPIDTVLSGVCEISASNLKVITPFALDACTKDTIWGVGSRTSGKSMADPYPVGRDTIVWKFVSEYSTAEVECEQYVFIQSDMKPEFNCDSLKSSPIERVLHDVCETDSAGMNFTVPFALDACTKDTIWGVGTRTSGEPMGGIYKVGRDTIVWKFVSEYSTAEAECEQYIYIKSDKALEFNCDSLNNAPIERVLHDVCEIDSAGLNLTVPFALDACTKDTIWGVGVRKSGEPMGGIYKVGRDTITWTFISEYSTDTVVCDQYLYIKSDKALEFDCDSLKDAPIERVLEGVCEIDSAGLNFTVPFALDACTKDTIWGVGVRKSGEPMGGIYKVGRDTITWTFISEYSSDTATCDQYLFIQSDLKPIFDCDSLKSAPIDTVLSGVCEISAADLNINIPFALDACTKDTIWGKGTRTSGKGMNDNFAVGRDTIVWVFDSEYSTANDTCEQYVFIQSDLKPKFDCDSLHNAPIERVLEGVCEIDSAGLNMIVPFALDACTNDTIWGRGTRTSGEPMGGIYKVGRDTIVWVFDSEYSTANDTCEQYVFIQSDLKPKFDCDSLHNAPIDTVLHGVCEIDSAGLNFQVPFALDACTNDTIWGVGTRKSGEPMGGIYKVGRDTIVWVFDSEYSTANDTCEQYIFIQSDLTPKFNCDSLKNSPIEKVLDGVCEITPEDLGVKTPFAFDACTNDTVWGVGERTSGRAMTDTYVVGPDTIVWRFISEYSVDTAICEQYVFIQSNKGIEFDCDSLNNAPIERVLHGVCEVDSATLNFQVPFAMDGCTNDTVWGVGTRKSGLPMGGAYYVGRDTIVWKFSSAYTTEDVLCEQYIFIQSDIAPLFNCDSLKNSPIDTVLHGVCEIDSAGLNFQVPFALDACTKDTIWGVGTRKSGEPMGGIYKVGRDTIVWVFDSEYSTVSDTCEQYIFIQSDMAPLFDCDSLMRTPIERDLHGVCEIDSADMNLEVPFALDACTKDTIWGVGERTSGLSMGDKYKVGRDTIIWRFISEYSTDTALCEQYVFIRSDLTPKFDCDSLKNSPIDTILHDACEISAADLNINTPFALDACTNDTVWGVGKRTSGLSMDDPFRVGRDTIIWRFVSTYSSVAEVCEQYVFIRSDKKLEFDCDSLMNTPVERVLEGVCEISAADLELEVPFAIDACTNQKIFGEGVRKSGRGMDEAYVVGRDTIVWTFISEYSTDTSVCEQYVYIQSDLKPVFNCDSLKQEVIEKVLEGVCEVSAADLNITTPIAYDACTKDPIPGVGTRKSGRGMDDPYVVGRDTIIWVFDSEYSTLSDTCEQYVYIQSDMKPKFDCDSLKNDPIKKVLSGVCEISAADLNVNTPFALDVCTNDTVWGVGTRKSGKAMTDNYVVGNDTIVWVFDSEYSTANDTCEQYVFIQSDLEPIFNCDSLKNTPINKVLTGVCEISAEDLNVNTPFALDACTKDTVWGVGRRTSGRDMDSSYVVGRDTIVWTFTSLYSTTVVECEQYVFIQSDLTPKFDCDELTDTTMFLAMDKCEIPAGQLILPTPVAKDACTDDDVPGDPTRDDGLTLSDAYPVGTTTVTWTFVSPYSTTPKVCEQHVIVKDTIVPVPHCEDLDTIHADITATSAHKNLTTYEEAVAAGLVAPTLDDLCDGLITATGLREDGSPLEGDFEIGLTTIIWTYTDKSGNSSTCTQIVQVEDHGTDTLFCPGDLDGKVFACVEDIPGGYDSFEAFKDAGGSFTTEYKIVDGSFRYTDTYQGDSCTMIVTRKYQVTDTRGDIDTCEEVIYIKDTISPRFDFILRDTTLSCEDSIFSPIVVTATDNCDKNVIIKMEETNDRGKDPNSCDYFNYDIVRSYYAYDRCGNMNSMFQIIRVRDTVGPTFTYPDGWRDTVLAKSLKGCTFEVPDFTLDVKSMVNDNCTEIEQLSVVQIPPAGSAIQNSMWVWVRVSDMCGNADSIAKYVRVQSPSSIVSLDAFSTDTCVTDEVGVYLASQSIRYASGYVEQVMPNGRIRKLPSVFSYDYYRGSVAHENLMYSDNPRTYKQEFAEYVAMYGSEYNTSKELTTLHQKSESGIYSFVAMDTMTGCADTASAYINILERPKISMVSAKMPVCEGNSIDLDPYLRCVDSMGATMKDQYWMLDGERFDPKDSVDGPISYDFNGKVISYYAENICGSSTSLNSHALLTCYDDTLTKEDSLIYLDRDTIAYEMLRVNQLFSADSILLDVHKRYNPDSIVIETDPHDPARIWNGESITLTLKTNYDYHYLVWRKVRGKYDMENYNSLEGEGFFFDDPDDVEDEVYESSGYLETPYIVDYPKDTAYYYATISDGVCPETPSRLTEVDVLQQLPTAFTPHTKDGFNDVFMKNHHVVIFDRYGQKVFEGVDGWPGTHNGHDADPAVYFYEVEMGNGLIVRGTIEVVKMH